MTTLFAPRRDQERPPDDRRVLWCRSCRQPAERGELLRAFGFDGEFVVHRPTVRPACFVACGTRCDSLIELLDPAAAAEYDRAECPPGERYGEREAADALRQWERGRERLAERAYGF